MKQFDGSFRDPAGYVFADGDEILRTVNPVYEPHWRAAEESGLFRDAVKAGWMTPFAERPPVPGAWKTVSTERVPFISYPYEWCFGQLRDAALLTLDLQDLAIDRGMTLKDASAYNAQFHKGRPVFIDLLSFERREEGEPWTAYRQFCMHFLAPLALTAKVDLRCGVWSKLWVDGIPLALAAKTLPVSARFRPGLLWHLFLHARMEARHGDARRSAAKARAVHVSRTTVKGIVDHLRGTIRGLRLPGAKTEWGDYYSDTNYTSEAADFKLAYVAQTAEALRGGRLAVDLGANTGRYSRALAGHFSLVLAADIDPLAVERHYAALRADPKAPPNVLPLVLDLGNPSPALGWACRERDSFDQRCRADLLTALALIHHLVITAGIPLARVAEYFARLLGPGGTLILEFVPKGDSQIERLLAARKDVFDDYSPEGLRRAFAPYFEDAEPASIPGSMRTLHRFRRKG